MKDKGSSDSKAHPQRPRSPRVPVNFSLVVEGRTTKGEPFTKQAKVVQISRAGATIMVDAKIVAGDRLTLMQSFGRKLEAEVNGVWIDKHDGKQRVGVKLLDSGGWFAD